MSRGSIPNLSEEQVSQFRLIILFIMGVFSLLFAGFTLHPRSSIGEFFLLLALSAGGTTIVYGYDFAQLKRSRYNELVANVLGSFRETLFFFIFIVFIAPLSFFYLSVFRIQMLLFICLCGLIYSMPMSIQGKRWKLKQLVLVKNIIIGLSWGALVLVGAGTAESLSIKIVFLFASLQVVVGSMIRDLSDLEKDALDDVVTIPVRFGIPASVRLLHVINVISVFPLLFLPFGRGLNLMIIIVLWRMLVIWKVSKDHKTLNWTQTYNILTCVIIGLAVAILNQNQWLK